MNSYIYYKIQNRHTATGILHICKKKKTIYEEIKSRMCRQNEQEILNKNLAVYAKQVNVFSKSFIF